MSDQSTDSALFEGPNFSTEAEETFDEPVAHSGGNVVEGGKALVVLEHLARSIVDDAEAVVVEASRNRSGVKLSLHVNPSDMGRVIGRRGRIAQAIRTVVRAAGARDGIEASVDIVD